MSRIFFIGSEVEIGKEKSTQEARIDPQPSQEIWCYEHERENIARGYVEGAEALYHPGKLIAADYEPTPYGIGIIVTLWYLLDQT